MYAKPGSHGIVKGFSVNCGTVAAPLGLTDNVDNSLNTIGPSPYSERRALPNCPQFLDKLGLMDNVDKVLSL